MKYVHISCDQCGRDLYQTFPTIDSQKRKFGHVQHVDFYVVEEQRDVEAYYCPQCYKARINS